MKSLVWLFPALAVVTTGSAIAQPAPDPAARRRELLDHAFEMSSHGNHSAALQLADQAGQIQMSPSLRMFLAEEHEFLSQAPEGGAHLVEAVTQAGDCVREASAQTTLNNRVRILQRCAEVFDRLNPRVAHVRVDVPRPTPEGMRVRVNEREIAERDWGEPIAVLPGEVIVEGSAIERGTFRRAVVLELGRAETVAITLQPRAERSGGSTLATTVTGWSLVGLGVVAGAVGIFQLITTNGQASDALNGNGEQGTAWARYTNDINARRTLSASQVCDRAATDGATNPDAAIARNLCDANSTARTLAYAFGIGGAVLAAAGVTLVVLTSRHEPSRAVRIETTPILGVGVAGASLALRF